METSTPNQTPIRNANNTRTEWSKETPLRKRVSILFERNENNKIWKSNDLNERDNRRASIVARKSILARNVDNDSSPGLNDSIRILNEKDIKGQLLICAKLNAENKINADNAWKLRVIDLLKQFVKKDNPDILKVAGSSLEVAGKVYGIRVDDLHAAGLKLASTLARNDSKKSTQQGDNDNENPNISENESGQVQKKKKQKKRRSLLCEDRKHTINNDTKSFKEPLPKLESCAFSAKVESSVSATDNLFTNNMKTDNAGYRFIFLDETKYFTWVPNSDLSDELEEITIEREDIPTTLQVCAAFKDFDVDVWDPDEQMDLGRKSINSQEIILDDNGIPIPELDGSVHDVFQDVMEEDANDEGFEEEVILPPLLQEKDPILDFQPSNQLLVNSIQKSEYSYNTIIGTCAGKIDQIWAGPSHWKMKHVKRPKRLVYTGQDKLQQDKEKKQGPRKKVEPVLLDFADLDGPIETFKLMTKKKPPKEISEDKITFPLFHSACKEIIDHLEELILVPSMKPIRKDETQIDCEVAEYKFDNPNDSNYIPNHLVDDHEPDLADDNFEECGRGDFMDDNLIGMPEMVAHSDMYYAMRAKKMDMKKLKTAVWQVLTNRDSYDLSAKVMETSFSSMYKKLPEELTENMKKELSCPIAFIALLHLCNEQNLSLKKGADISDFKIQGPC